MTNIFTSIFDFITGRNNSHVSPALTASTSFMTDPISLYETLDILYNNDENIHLDDTTRRLRTVVNRSVEFYVSKMLPGDKLNILSPDTPNVAEAVNLVLKASNFQRRKPAILRSYAKYGDSFLRVRKDEQGNLRIEEISPLYVTNFTEDGQELLTTLRIDVPTLNANKQSVTYTEYWDLEGVRTWTHTQDRTTPIENLGTPEFTATLQELGTTFIPIVHAKFKDTGDLRGQSCVYHALDKIYEANRLATRLHDLQFRHNKPIWAVMANAQDKDGRPIPPPKIKTSGTGANATAAEETKEFVLGDVISLPGMSTLESLIPDIKYADALAILKDMMNELEQDLPELRWYSLNESQLSGAAIQKLLAGAVDRALEGRNNFIAAMKLLGRMILHMGNFNGITGTFDDNIWEFDLMADDMFGQTVDERAATLKTLRESSMPLALAMKITGFSQQEIDEAIAGQAAERAQSSQDLTNSLSAFNQQ